MVAPLISFIGAGRLAHTLAPALDNLHYAVREVYSPTRVHAENLCQQLYKAEVKDSLDFSTSISQIFIIAVLDDCINHVAQEIKLPQGALLIHTSGSQSLQCLALSGTSYTGVFYPLQTFSLTRKVSLEKIPMLIEGSNKEVEEVMISMAKSIGSRVKKIDSAQRKTIHIAAIFASNFVNHMLTISSMLLQKEELDYNLLKPLIQETVEKGFALGLEKAQSGPALRGDAETINSHITWLQEVFPNDSLAIIYRGVSEHIRNHYNRTF